MEMAMANSMVQLEHQIIIRTSTVTLSRASRAEIAILWNNNLKLQKNRFE